MPKVDLQFRLQGNEIPVDHGYHLFGAISDIIPEIHDNREVGVHAINGRFIGNRLLALTKRSRLTIRTPVEHIKPLLALAGKSLRIAGHTVQVGVPESRALVPSQCLYSRLVIIKGFMEPESFLQAVCKQLEAMGIDGTPILIKQPQISEANKNRLHGTRSPFLRRTLRIRGKEIVGFAVRVEGLDAENSIKLQEEGIGGRRRFGCGIFIPYKGGPNG